MNAVIHIIEPREEARQFTLQTLRATPLECGVHNSLDTFLDVKQENIAAGCILLDNESLNGQTESYLQRLVSERGCYPILVMTAAGELASAARLVDLGAMAVLEKPFEVSRYRATIDRALRAGSVCKSAKRRYTELAAGASLLTARERQVLEAIVAGKLNKEIASELNVSVRTVESDRAKIVEKFSAGAASEVVGKYAQYTLLRDLGFDGSSALPCW